MPEYRVSFVVASVDVVNVPAKVAVLALFLAGYRYTFRLFGIVIIVTMVVHRFSGGRVS